MLASITRPSTATRGPPSGGRIGERVRRHDRGSSTCNCRDSAAASRTSRGIENRQPAARSAQPRKPDAIPGTCGRPRMSPRESPRISVNGTAAASPGPRRPASSTAIELHSSTGISVHAIPQLGDQQVGRDEYGGPPADRARFHPRGHSPRSGEEVGHDFFLMAKLGPVDHHKRGHRPRSGGGQMRSRTGVQLAKWVSRKPCASTPSTSPPAGTFPHPRNPAGPLPLDAACARAYPSVIASGVHTFRDYPAVPLSRC